MKFICDRGSLLKEIGIAQDVVPSGSNSSLTILSNIHLDAHDGTLTIKATDINVYYETKTPVTVLEDGSTTVFGNKLYGMLAQLPDGEIEFVQTGQSLAIQPKPGADEKSSKKKIKYSLRTMSGDQYPEFHSFEKLEFFTLPISDFKEMIEQTAFAVSDDPTRFHMKGVFLEKNEDKLVMVATDGRRLALIERKFDNIPDFPGAIIPTKILTMIAKYGGAEGPISVSITEKYFFAEFGPYKFYSSLFEGQFPNYRKVIPENQTNTFTVNREDLLQAMEGVHLLVEKQSERLFFKISKDGLSVYVPDSEIGEGSVEIEAEFDGEETQFALKYGNLKEPLKVLTSNVVKFQFTDISHAFTLKPEPEEDYSHVMMPMQTDI